MKKIIIVALVVFSTSFNLIAQEKQVYAVDKVLITMGIEYNFALSKEQKTDNGESNRVNNPHLYLGLEWELNKGFGLWGSVGMCYAKSKKFAQNTNAFPNIDLNDYYIKDEVFYTNDNAETVLLQVGAFYKFRHKKWTFAPYLAYGINDQQDYPSLSYTLKHKGSNTMYNISYAEKDRWSDGDKVMSSVNIQFKVHYRLNNRLGVFCGVSYRHYPKKIYFDGTLSDYYDGSLIESIRSKGNNLSTLGVNVGITM